MTLITIILMLMKIFPGNASSGEIPQTLHHETGATFVAGVLTITTQPVDLNDCKGNKVTFSVSVQGGAGTIHYLWKRKRPGDASFTTFGARDSVKLPVYNIGTGAEAPDKTLYQVTVSDQESEATSVPAILNVNQITGISPVGVAVYSVNEGDSLQLNVLTSGNPPSAFQWIKKYGNNDWRNVGNNSTVTGSNSEQLTFTKISVRDSGIYKVRVTFPKMDQTQCTETSQITRTIRVKPVIDTVPPEFLNLADKCTIICPDDLEKAEWNELRGDILPERAGFHRLQKFNTRFDLAFNNFHDNITPVSDLIIHWGIFSADSPYGPVKDAASTLLENMTGQMSLHPENIDLEGPPEGSKTYRILFWLEDRAGNITPDTLRYKLLLTVTARPEIISKF